MKTNNIEERAFVASWRFEAGALESQELARAILEMVGEVVAMDPTRYDLNGRGQWRTFNAQRLLIDMVTQRTQLVQLVEERGVEEGGSTVVIATGKHGEPPQAVASWSEVWPVEKERQERWVLAAKRAFDVTPLSFFVVRMTSLDEGQGGETVQMVAAKGGVYERLEASLGPAHHRYGQDQGLWSFFDDPDPPGELALSLDEEG